MEGIKLAEAFDIAFNDVIRTMAGFDLSSESVEVIESKEISGVMLLLGQKNKIATLSMNKSTSAIIISYMTAIPYADLKDEDLFDGVSELINLVAGRAKAILKDTEDYFQITPPFTIIGDGHRIIHKEKMKKLSRIYSAGENKICLEVFLID